MKKIVRLTERDLTRLVKRIINEGNQNCFDIWEEIETMLTKYRIKIPPGCPSAFNQTTDEKRCQAELYKLYSKVQGLKEKHSEYINCNKNQF